MQLKILYAMIIAITLIFSVPATWGAGSLEPKFRIKIEISCADKILRNETLSAIKSEFRRLGDVSVVNDDNVDFVIQIVAIETKNVRGFITGVDYSTVITSPFDNRSFISLLPERLFEEVTKKEEKQNAPPSSRYVKKEISEEDRELLAKLDRDRKMLDEWTEKNKWATAYARKQFWTMLTDNLVRIDNHMLNTGARSDIQDICRSIVASIDVNQLENIRKQRSKPVDGILPFLLP